MPASIIAAGGPDPSVLSKPQRGCSRSLGGWPRSLSPFQTTTRVPPVPRFWGPGMTASNPPARSLPEVGFSPAIDDPRRFQLLQHIAKAGCPLRCAQARANLLPSSFARRKNSI